MFFRFLLRWRLADSEEYPAGFDDTIGTLLYFAANRVEHYVHIFGNEFERCHSVVGTFPTSVTITPGSTNVSGTVLFTTGTSPAAVSAAVTVLFAVPLAQAPNVCIPTAQNAAAGMALNNLIITSPATTGFVVFSGFAELTASTTYQLGYACF